MLVLPLLAMVLAAAPASAESEPTPVQVAEIHVCRDVDRETRAPLGVGDAFPQDVERLYCFTRLTGAADTTQVTHLWLHEDQIRSRVPLAVRSPDWRTWSSKSILPRWSGEWEVRVLDRDGLVLGASTFRIEDAPTPEEAP